MWEQNCPQKGRAKGKAPREQARNVSEMDRRTCMAEAGGAGGCGWRGVGWREAGQVGRRRGWGAEQSYWNTALPACLHIVCGYAHATRAETENIWPAK